MSVRKITLLISAAGLALSAVPPISYAAWLAGPTLLMTAIAAISLSGAALAWLSFRRVSPPRLAASPQSRETGAGARSIDETRAEVLDALPDPVIEADSSGRIVFVNRAALIAMGCGPEEASARFAELLRAAEASLPEGGRVAFEAPLVMDDGSRRFFEFKSVQVGKVTLFIGRDSDEKKRLLDELGSARMQEVETATKLRRTISDLEEFALLAIRRELKMQEIRERFVRLKEEHEINKEFPG